MNKGDNNHGVQNEDDESIETAASLNDDNNSGDENRMPALQERDREDSSSDDNNDDDEEDNNDETDENRKIELLRANYKECTNNRRVYDDDDDSIADNAVHNETSLAHNLPELQERDREDSSSEDDSDDDGNSNNEVNEEKKIAALVTPFKEYANIEIPMPALICKLDKEDSSDDDDSGGEDNPRQREMKVPKQPHRLPIEARLEQLKEAIERISSAQRNDLREQTTTSTTEAEDNKTNKEVVEEDLYFVPSDEEGEEVEAEEATTSDSTEEEDVPRRMNVTKDNLPFGHICDDVVEDNDTPYVRVYCQNVCGIYDREGIGLDSTFKELKQAGADIFMLNETHGDESNAKARRVLRMARQRMWSNNNENCKIVHSSSTAPVLNFNKPGGNMVGITGSLVGRIRDTITDPYGRWCGYTIIGRDNKEIMIITAYNVSQYKNANVGADTLFNQQVSLYKLQNIRDPDPKQIFIDDLKDLVSQARKEDKDIILTGDFNEVVGDDPRGMAKVLLAGNLTDAHSNQHGQVDISTYTRGIKRLDYVFVTVEILTRTTDRPQIPLLSRNDSNSQTSQSNPKSNSNDKCLSPLTQATQRLKDSLR